MAIEKAKEILLKHTKSCYSHLVQNPFLEQAVLNAINEALMLNYNDESVCNSCGGEKKSLESGFEQCTKCEKIFA